MGTESIELEAGKGATLLQPEKWLERYGDMLYRHAWARLRDRAAAEDLVQQTFLEGIKARERYDGRISEKNWLFTILRHNLIDRLRRKVWVWDLEDAEAGSADAYFHEAGYRKGKWKEELEPVEWRSPEKNLMNEEFWRVFHRCLGKMPAKMARVTLLRELDDLPAGEICQTLQISQSNLWTLQHRARLALQRCLQIEWFK